MVGAWPTNDGLVMTYVAAPASEFHAFRADPEGHDPGRARPLRRPRRARPRRRARRARLRHGRHAEPLPSCRSAPGWALVGDAGLVMDPVTGPGIADALRDAELLADAVAAGLDGGPPLDEALAGYQRRARRRGPADVRDDDRPRVVRAAAARAGDARARARRQTRPRSTASSSVLTGSLPVPEYFTPRQMLRLIGVRGLWQAMRSQEEDAHMSEPVGTLSDAALVRAAQAGDTAGLGALLERHRSRLHAIAVSVVGHGPAAEDAVQDTFLIALRRIGELRDPAAARAWLAAILVNVCRGELRRPVGRPVAGVEPWDRRARHRRAGDRRRRAARLGVDGAGAAVRAAAPGGHAALLHAARAPTRRSPRCAACRSAPSAAA